MPRTSKNPTGKDNSIKSEPANKRVRIAVRCSCTFFLQDDTNAFCLQFNAFLEVSEDVEKKRIQTYEANWRSRNKKRRH
jgi:hypothetical protein